MEFKLNLTKVIFILLLSVKEKEFNLSELISIILSRLNLVFHKDFNSKYNTIQNFIYKLKNEGIIENSNNGYKINEKQLRADIKQDPELSVYATLLFNNSFLEGFLIDESIVNRIKGL